MLTPPYLMALWGSEIMPEEKGVLRKKFGYDGVFCIILENIESTCAYLNRKPIPELLDDASIGRRRRNQN